MSPEKNRSVNCKCTSAKKSHLDFNLDLFEAHDSSRRDGGGAKITTHQNATGPKSLENIEEGIPNLMAILKPL